MVSPLYRFIGLVSGPVVRGPYRLRAKGMEHLPEGGFVLAANHTSNFDPWPLGLPLLPRRQLRFMAKSELFNPLLGPILRAGGAFKVRRGEGDIEAMRTAVDLVRSGEIVVMFPEGTRRQKGLRKKHVARAHTGAARIALSAGSPLVPAAIAGTDRLLRLGPLRVAYGKPLDLADLDGLDTKRAAEAATERLMTRIEELRAELNDRTGKAGTASIGRRRKRAP
jgi:1-acyl-sn-glycerol-3-phosphate acyltransferase